MRAVAVILTFLLAPCDLQAQSSFVERAEITNLGIYELQSQRRIYDKNLAGGTWNVVTAFRNVQSTTTIPARLCTSFGFEYRIHGEPRGAEVSVKMVTRFPKQGIYNPDTRLTTYRHETLLQRRIGQLHFRSYTIEKHWETVPGVWTFEIWYGNQQLIEQSFTLVEACIDRCDKSNPEPVGCEANPITSLDTIGYTFAALTSAK